METLDSKSKSLVCKLPHQQSLPTPHHTRHQLQQQLSQPIAESNKSSDSMQVSSEQQSDKSSLSSVDLESSNDCECDKASMSSCGQGKTSKQHASRPKQIDTKQREEHQKEVEELKQEISKLKCDKLDLLRQNVVRSRNIDFCIHLLNLFCQQTCQRDIKRLRERELSLQRDLMASGKEILELRERIKVVTSSSTISDL